MKLVVVSDLHLDWVTAGIRRFDDVAKALEAAKNKAIALAEIDDDDTVVFVCLGDLFNPDSGPIVLRCTELLIGIAGQLALRGVSSIWVAGNHDVVEDGSGTTSLTPMRSVDEWCHDIPEQPAYAFVAEEPEDFDIGTTDEDEDDPPFLVLPFTATSHAYDPEAKIKEWAAKYPRVKKPIILSHLTGVEGVIPGEEVNEMPRGREVTFPIDAVREHFPGALILQGHFHRRQVHTVRGVTFHICGSLARLTHSEEENDPGYLVVDVP
ncbi:MAG: hypothetical protein PVSMB8_07400 [Vulcanimicrobiaceae bacterium]